MTKSHCFNSAITDLVEITYIKHETLLRISNKYLDISFLNKSLKREVNPKYKGYLMSNKNFKHPVYKIPIYVIFSNMGIYIFLIYPVDAKY